MNWHKLFTAVVVLGISSARLPAQEGDVSQPSLSRQMRLGIQFYEKRDDAQAMDRFMEVLTRGDPNERPLANEYINLITHRMNTGEKLPMPPKPRAAAPAPAPEAPPVEEEEALQPLEKIEKAAVKAPAAPEVVVEPVEAEREFVAAPAARKASRPARAAVEAPARVEPVKANKALMRKEIKAKIHSLMEKSLKRLKSVQGVSVLLLENGDPSAVAIPSSQIFQSGLAFQKSASPILDALTSLAFSLSGTQIIILPEGAAVSDAKIQDMRRTMGISSQFFSAGIAPARVRVNLLNSQVEIPRPLQDFKGIIVLFVYNQPLNLTAENAMGDDSGPPLSLGIFPENFSPEKSEGVIIEFSVQDPPAGLVSWEFKLLQPSASDGSDLVALQQVVGGGPVFHQIYWNGRQNYFGSVLPAGRYECVLTGTDAQNKQRTIHRWIALTAPAVPLPSRPRAAEVSAQGRAPAAELPAELTQDAAPLIRRGPAAAALRKKKGKALRARKKKKGAPARESGQAAVKASSQEILFQKDTHEMMSGGEKTLARVAETLSYYPLENLDIVGHAHRSEPDAETLAQKRAQVAAGMLINKHKVDPKKIQVHSSVSENPSYKVDIRFSGESK